MLTFLPSSSNDSGQQIRSIYWLNFLLMSIVSCQIFSAAFNLVKKKLWVQKVVHIQTKLSLKIVWYIYFFESSHYFWWLFLLFCIECEITMESAVSESNASGETKSSSPKQHSSENDSEPVVHDHLQKMFQNQSEEDLLQILSCKKLFFTFPLTSLLLCEGNKMMEHFVDCNFRSSRTKIFLSGLSKNLLQMNWAGVLSTQVFFVGEGKYFDKKHWWDAQNSRRHVFYSARVFWKFFESSANCAIQLQ